MTSDAALTAPAAVHRRKVCVTGSNGFIGSWIVKLLLDRGYTVHGTVRNLDEWKNKHLKEMEGASDRLVLYKADMLDFESLRSAIDGCEGFFHTASPITNDPELVVRSAVEGTRNVIRAAAEAAVRRVVFTSSIGAVTMDPNRGDDVVVDESCWSDLEFCMQTKNMASEQSYSSDDTLDSTDYDSIAVHQNLVAATLLDGSTQPVPSMTSKQTGDKWVREMLEGSAVRFHNSFRMSQVIFLDLLQTLEENYGFHGTRRTASTEILALTLYILSHNESMRKTCERFQHSTETASRFFAEGIRVLLRLAGDVIQPHDRSFSTTPVEILHDTRYMPFFKDCVGAIDGTHVHACVPAADQVSHIGRHGTTTQNVMAACDFNMCFTFVMAGWEGSAHDSRIFQYAIRDPQYNFPHPPRGKYYLVDSGYPLQRGYLKPYQETRYHLPDFARGGRPPEGRREIFNHAHSSLRSVIERSFGIWKKKWAILRDMPSYSVRRQADIVMATMALHNFIRRHPSRADIDFSDCGGEGGNDGVGTQGHHEVCTDTSGGMTEMMALRDRIADHLYNARS